ncbi:hypothetical protein ABPG73_006118, partial [Tetrahymena malaccensis]
MKQEIQNQLSMKNSCLYCFDKKNNIQQINNKKNGMVNYADLTIDKAQQHQLNNQNFDLNISEESSKYDLNSNSNQIFKSQKQRSIKFQSNETQNMEQLENSTKKIKQINKTNNNFMYCQESIYFPCNFQIQQLSFKQEQCSIKYDSGNIKYLENSTEKINNVNKTYDNQHNYPKSLYFHQNVPLHNKDTTTIKVKKLKEELKKDRSKDIYNFLLNFDTDLNQQQNFVASGGFGVVFDGKMYVNNKIEEVIFKIQLSEDNNKSEEEEYLLMKGFEKNINLIQSGIYIICDFGTSIKNQENKKEKIVNVKGYSKKYVPNEVIQPIYKFNYQSDVYSLGKTLQEIFSNYEIIQNQSQSESEKSQFEQFKKILENYAIKDQISERKTCQELHKLFYEAVIF